MRPLARSPVLLVVIVLAAACSTGAAAPALVDIGAGLQGPAGLIATIEATGLTHVSAFAQDAQGRLWAATANSADSGADAVYLIPAAGAMPIKVIAPLHTPLGLLWLSGSLYVASAGRVDAYDGFDGTAFTTTKTIEAFETGVGEVNGLALGPDGRIRLGISAPCDHCAPTTAWSASVVSFRADGSDLRTDASGIRAPVGLAYMPGTADLFVTMDQRDDLGEATPGDWLALVRSGQDWGFPDCYGQTTAPCSADPHPIASLDPHAAVSGVAIVTGGLGAATGPSAIVAEWATGKVVRVALTPAGSTYTGTASPFISGLKNPVPVLVDAAGGLVVGDWTSGTIYRVAGG